MNQLFGLQHRTVPVTMCLWQFTCRIVKNPQIIWKLRKNIVSLQQNIPLR